MAIDDIQLKLQHFLTNIDLLTEEQSVVYLLVEIRKLIDKETGTPRDEYTNIKFYCDWTLHTKKSRNFQGLENIFELIYQSCKNHLENESRVGLAKELVDFLYFEKLREHLLTLFERYNLPMDMLKDRKIWVSFVKTLLEVLTDQPITNIPNDNISEICVIGANDQGAAIRVYFTITGQIIDEGGKKRPFYQLVNAF